MKVRDTFFTEIYNRVKQGEDIVITSSDIGAPSLDDFRKNYGNRFVNVGIAEQNLLAVSAGLQLSGKKVIAYGLNPFPVTRAFDQVRNVMASLQIPITLTALNAGSCSAEAGYTHMPVENMSVMRTLKNIQIINLSDNVMTRKLVDEILNNPKPRYIQFDKYIDGDYYSAEDIDFEKGFITNKVQSDIAVVTYGIFANRLLAEKLSCKVIDCFSLPLNEKEFMEEIKNCRKIFTIEDGILDGGVGSLVLEILANQQLNIPVQRTGLRFSQGYPQTLTNRDTLWKEEGVVLEELKKEVMAELAGERNE